jgi:hypothetical protein
VKKLRESKKISEKVKRKFCPVMVLRSGNDRCKNIHRKDNQQYHALQQGSAAGSQR